MPVFEKRRIGRTSLEVTALGLGCATLGGSRVEVSHREAEAIVHAAWAAGVRYIDTAPYYGFGRAERCVGDAMRGEPRDQWVLSTKVGRLLRPRPMPAKAEEDKPPMPFDPIYDYSYDGIMRSFEDSLQRLGLARIDILYVHDIGTMTHGNEAHPRLMQTLRDSGYRALESLRGGGAVRAIGIGVNEREVLLQAMQWGAWDAFLLAGRYTLLEQEPLTVAELQEVLELGQSSISGHLAKLKGAALIHDLAEGSARRYRLREDHQGTLRIAWRAMREPHAWRAEDGERLHSQGGQHALSLRPYALARLDRILVPG